MSPLNIVLVIVFLLGAIAFATHFTVAYLKGRKTWRWPAGKRMTVIVDGFTVHFIHDAVSLEFTVDETARRCAFAAQCLAHVVDYEHGRGEVVPREFAVHVADDETYAKIYDRPYGTKSAGMLQSISRNAGSGQIPLVACKWSKFASTPQTGSLVIHELLHFTVRILNLDGKDTHDRDHSNSAVWNLEEKAKDRFVALIAKV